MTKEIENDELQNILSTLNNEEKEYVQKILNEYEEEGVSSTFSNLLSEDYDEIPVDIETFLHEPKYLGNGLINEDGRFTVFPYWEETLKDIFPDPLKPPRYNTVALTGSIGIGKSFVAVICILYEIYRVLCLKNPSVYYNIQKGDTIGFAFMNITLHASSGVAWNKCQQLIKSSSWFKDKGHFCSKEEVVWEATNKNLEIICGSTANHFLGRMLLCIFFDEISFIPNQDIDKQKEKARALVDSAAARMQSRFLIGNYNPTLLILASSKRTEQSYLEEWIRDKKRIESKTTLIVDKPQWEIRPDKLTGKWFKVAVGNEFLPNELLPLDATEEEEEDYKVRGYSLLEVPYSDDYYENFRSNIETALTDIAGISIAGTNKFLSGQRIQEIISHDYQNLFTKDIIEVGDAPDDKRQYWDFIDLNRLDPTMKNKPLFIHLDLSFSQDKTGIAGIWTVGKKPSEIDEPESHDLFYRVAFAVSVKAPKGHQISFEKDRNFIYWLKDQGFNIRGISTDSKESASMAQDFKARGFNYQLISVDKVDPQSKTCKPYEYLKSTIYEKRLEIYAPTKDQDLLVNEWVNLEKDNFTQKVDHPSGGCFTGDTKVALCDDRNLTFKQLLIEFEQGKENYVFSVNPENHRIQIDKIVNVCLTKPNAELVEVVLSNKERIKCTPDHRFMLNDESYKEARHLKEGDELRSLFNINGKRRPKIDECFTVAEVNFLSTKQSVYDLTTENNHNFLLSAGVFVHNSKDQSDSVCLKGDTPLYLLSGEKKTISDLYDEYTAQDNNFDEWVLAYDTENNTVIPLPIKEVVNNGYKDNLITLTFDNGKTLTCTQDHLLLTRDGNYIEAQDALNVSLMSFTVENKIMFKNRDYPFIYIPDETNIIKGKFIHRLVAEYVYDDIKKEKQQQILGTKQWVVIHHKDCNRHNNSPQNLEYLTNVEHSIIHTQMNQTEKKREQMRKAAKDKALGFLSMSPEQFSQMIEANKETSRQNMISYNKSETHKAAIRKEWERRKKENPNKYIKEWVNSSQTPEVKAKRLKTCQERYGGLGFTSSEIQKRCKQSILKHYGVDNVAKVPEVIKKGAITKTQTLWNDIVTAYNIPTNHPITWLDFKLLCYKFTKGNGRSCDTHTEKLLEAGIPVVVGSDTQEAETEFNSLRNLGNCIHLFQKDLQLTTFTYEQFISYYNDKLESDKQYRSRFKKCNPTYEKVLKITDDLQNHRVIKIETAESGEVFDIKLDTVHNFALPCGVFVHNCGSLYNASQYGREYAYNYGESIVKSFIKVNAVDTSSDKDLKRIAEARQQQMLLDELQSQEEEENRLRNSNVASGHRKIFIK